MAFAPPADAHGYLGKSRVDCAHCAARLPRCSCCVMLKERVTQTDAVTSDWCM